MTKVTLVRNIPPIDRRKAHTLAVEENARMLTLLRSLSDDDWSKPTDCTGWDVRALAAHVLGASAPRRPATLGSASAASDWSLTLLRRAVWTSD